MPETITLEELRSEDALNKQKAYDLLDKRVLQQVVQDLTVRLERDGVMPGPDSEIYQAFLDAAVWTFDPPDERHYFSLETICDRLGLEPQPFREAVAARLTPMRREHIKNLLRRYL